MSESLYDFSTAEEAPFITIDGARYDLRIRMEWVDTLRFRDIGEEIMHLSEKRTDRSEQDEARLKELLDRIISEVVDAPPEVLDKLNDLQRFAIWRIHGEEVKKRQGPFAAMADGARSPDSGGTTEGQPKSG